MHCLILVTLLAASAFAGDQFSSISERVGSGQGMAFTLQGNGRITGVRLWESGNRIHGIQVRFGHIWSAVGGAPSGRMQTMELRDDEAFVQVSGKWSYYITWMIFVTDHGRFIMAGSPQSYSFNMYPVHPRAELSSISGSHNYGQVTSFAAQWDVISNNTEAE